MQDEPDQNHEEHVATEPPAAHELQRHEGETASDPLDVAELSEQSGMSTKDFVTVGLSTLAFVVSVASFYMANVRVVESVQARIANLDIESSDANDPTAGYRNGFIVAHYTFVNTGNRPAVILGAQYAASNKSNMTGDGFIGFGGQARTSKDAFPLLLQSHEIRVINLSFPIGTLIERFKDGAISSNANSSASNPFRSFYCGFSFETVDSEGAVHLARAPLEMRVDVSTTAWESLASRYPDQRYLPTQLISKSAGHNAKPLW